MVSSTYLTPDEALGQRVEAIKARYQARDVRARQVRAVRHGDFDQVSAGIFNDEWPRPIVANMIDVLARHAAAAFSPLPTVTCSSGTMGTDVARQRADKRTKIANGYLAASDVRSQMQTGADQFNTYGILVACVEPDWSRKIPGIYYEDSISVYPVWDRQGNTVEVVRLFDRTEIELVAEYPNLEGKLRGMGFRSRGANSSDKIEVAKYVSATRIVYFLPKNGNLVLQDIVNPLGRCTYVCTKKPSLDAEIHGSFDDLIYVQLARHVFQMYALEAADQAVNAPIAVPADVLDIPMGPNAIIKSQNPQGIGRVHLEVPQGVWAAAESLKQEIQYGAISPQALGGSVDASVVTGRGVQELMAGYSQQVSMGQQTLVRHFEQVIDLCFDMDETLWPNETKDTRGMTDGSHYRLTYMPSKDIDGDYSSEIVYGGVAGMDPNRGLVFLLQTLGGGIVSKEYVRRTLQADINPSGEEQQIALEEVRSALLQGVAAYMQSIPAVIAQGGDPSTVIMNGLAITEALQKNQSLESVLGDLFKPPPPPPPAPDQSGQPGGMEGMVPPDVAAQAGAGGTALAGVNPNVATQGPGGKPDLATMFAGMSAAGKPNLSASVSRQRPALG